MPTVYYFFVLYDKFLSLQVSVIIVNYNVKFFLEQCLYAVTKALKNIESEILVIDNGSVDESIAYLQPIFSSVIFIQNSSNEGFAKANNRALTQAKGKYILFLNPDTIIGEESLQQCIGFFEAHKNAGAVGVRMIDGSGKFLPESKRSFPTMLSAIFKLSGLANVFNRSSFFNKYALGNLDELQIHEVDVIAGAFMMVKKSLLNSLNGFDERYFMYGEDIDLSYRIHKAGFKNYYVGTISIIHFKGESARKHSIKYIQSFYGAMSIFVQNYYNYFVAYLLSIIIMLRVSIAFLLLVMSKPFTIFTKNKKINNTVVIGSATEYEAALKIVAPQKPIHILGRISVTDSAEKTIGHFSSLEMLLKKYAIEQIIFCEGELSFESIIECISSLPHQYKYFFFPKNSQCIIGSTSKTTIGETINEKN